MQEIVIASTMWGRNFMIPLYLFFGGLTAGLGIVAVVADLLEGRYKACNALSKLAIYAAFPAWVLGSIFVIFHLGRPFRGLFFPLYFSNYGSWMTYGGWAMGLGGPFIVVYGVLRHFDLYPLWRRAIGLIGIPLMLWIAFNTAMLLSAATRVPLWSRSYLPALFINSGLLTGVAGAGLLLILAARYFPFGAVREGAPHQVLLGASVGALAFEVIEVGILYSLVNSLATVAASPVVSAVASPRGSPIFFDYLVRGALAGWFWWGVVGLGLVVPIVLGIVGIVGRRWEQQLAGVKFACILLGAAVLRFVIVWGGDVRPAPAIAQTLRDALSLIGG